MSSEANPSLPKRLGSIDVYRGFVMFLMMGELFRFCAVASNLRSAGQPSGFWDTLCHHQEHVEWVGCVLHDLIQPSFSFLVGVALPFSIASRIARGQSRVGMWFHALWRAVILVLLGVFLRSTGASQTNWTLEDTLSQIGLGYPFLFALGMMSRRIQWGALAVLLVGYWAAFAVYTPGQGFDFSAVGVPSDWLQKHGHSGFAEHWQKNANLAWAADREILNWFPRAKEWVYNGGGYATLSFIPTLGTMLLGVLAGDVLRNSPSHLRRMIWLLIAGVAGIASGWFLNQLGICPIVKRIWTPSWVLFSGGWCFLLMATFYALIERLHLSRALFPLQVIGMNSIAAYCIAHLFDGFIAKNLKTHLGQQAFQFFGAAYEPFFHGAATFAVLWLILLWMYRQRLFLRI